jgi:tripartite-type tricarboxylate transporter receptor subunit TctC
LSCKQLAIDSLPTFEGEPIIVRHVIGFRDTCSSVNRAGKLRALAVTTATRSEALPDLPTVSDFLLGYEVTLWTGLGVPRNTPAEIVNRLN